MYPMSAPGRIVPPSSNVAMPQPDVRPGCWTTPIRGATALRALLWVVFHSVVVLLIVVAVLFAWKAVGADPPPTAAIALGVLVPVYLVQPAALYLHLLRPRTLGWDALGWRRPVHSPAHLLWQIPATMTGAALLAGAVLIPLGTDPGDGDRESLSELVQGGPALAVAGLLVVAVLVPIVEELVFRGLVLAGLRSRFSYPIGIALSAVVFTVVHVAPPAFPYLFVTGVALAMMAEWYRSVIPGMVLHGVNNAVVFIGVLAAV